MPVTVNHASCATVPLPSSPPLPHAAATVPSQEEAWRRRPHRVREQEECWRLSPSITPLAPQRHRHPRPPHRHVLLLRDVAIANRPGLLFILSCEYLIM